MATVQLIGVRPGVATVQKDDESPMDLAWGLLHEAQQQDGVAGYVYRWLMHEFCRCEFDQRQGVTWQSPRRDVDEIAASLRAQDAREAAEMEARRAEQQRLQDVADRRRQREQEISRVEAERRGLTEDDPWYPIPTWEVPNGIRFDVLGRDAGQIVERSYGIFGRAEAGRTDPYMMVHDRSDGSVRTYKRREVATV